MYNSSYEDYMQNVLGYSIVPRNTYQMQENIYELNDFRDYRNDDLERLYPDTYRMVYPMVQKVCMKANGPINEKMVNDMTTEIYNAMVETRTANSQSTKTGAEQRNSINEKKKEETRQQNFLLNDLIRILIVRELLRRPQMPPPRPPMGRPPRPPMGPNYPRNIDYPVM